MYKSEKCYIYGLVCLCVECNPERVMYVGQTRRSPEHRRRAHRDASRRPTHTDYFNVKSEWIRTHAYDTLGVVILEEVSEAELNDRERFWMDKLDTHFPAGLNTNVGGHFGSSCPGESNPAAKLTLAQVKEIIERIGTDMSVTSRSLGRDYDVTKTLILKIDMASLWPEVERPYGVSLLNRNRKVQLDPQLVRTGIKAFQETGSVTKASRISGVNYSTLRAYLRREGILCPS